MEATEKVKPKAEEELVDLTREFRKIKADPATVRHILYGALEKEERRA